MRADCGDSHDFFFSCNPGKCFSWREWYITRVSQICKAFIWVGNLIMQNTSELDVSILVPFLEKNKKIEQVKELALKYSYGSQHDGSVVKALAPQT